MTFLSNFKVTFAKSVMKNDLFTRDSQRSYKILLFGKILFWRGMKIKGNVHIYKNSVMTLWYEKQLKQQI